MATDLKKIADELTKLTVLEVNELKTLLKDEYGIEPAAAAVAVAAGGGGGADAPAAAEKTTFDVNLKAAGGAKLQVVKVVKVKSTSACFTLALDPFFLTRPFIRLMIRAIASYWRPLNSCTFAPHCARTQLTLNPVISNPQQGSHRHQY